MKRPIILSPQWSARRRSVSARRRALLHDVLGEPYDRDPCPHVLRTRRLIPDPLTGQPYAREYLQTLDAPCVRPGAHGREKGDSAAAEAVRLHATDDGRTWS